MKTYVQYGSGQSVGPDWLSFDASPTLKLQRVPFLGPLFTRRSNIVFPHEVLAGDIVKGLPVPEGTLNGVFASHVLEHLSYNDFWVALRNTLQMMKSGAIFRLIVPDLEARARRYISEVEQGNVDANSWFMDVSYLGSRQRPRNPQERLRAALGNSRHLWMWDEASMTSALQKSGFVRVRRCIFNDCEDQTFNQVEDASRFYDPDERIEECAMEARKP